MKHFTALWWRCIKQKPTSMPHSKGRQCLRKGWENPSRISFLTDGWIKSEELQLGSPHLYQMEEDFHSSTDRLVPTFILSMMSKLLTFIINWWIQNSMNLTAEGSRHLLLSLCRSAVLVQFNSALFSRFTRVKLSCLLDGGSYEFGERNMFQINSSCSSDFLVVVTPMTLGIFWLFIGSHFWALEAAYRPSHTGSTATLWSPETKNPDLLILRLKTCDV